MKPHTKKCRCASCTETGDTSISKQSKIGAESRITQKPNEQVKKESGKEEVDKLTETKRKKTDLGEPGKKNKVARLENLESAPQNTEKLAAGRLVGQQTEARTEPAASTGAISSNKTKLPAAAAAQPEAAKHRNFSTPVTASSFTSLQVAAKSSPAAVASRVSDILSPATLTSTKPSPTAPVSCQAGPTTLSSFSPSSSSDSLSSPTFLALSSGSPQISPITATSLGASVIPFPSKLSGIPSPQSTAMRHAPPLSTTPSFIASTALTTTVNNTTLTTLSSIVAQPKLEQKPAPNVLVSAMKPQFSIQMGPPKVETSIAATTFELATLGQQHQMPRSRLSAVMQVRCKAISAYLYVSKYESGSKGKCILLGDEWLTPNEFEEKSGSKAKKYLSSIKCLGRPLRAFVNSGKIDVTVIDIRVSSQMWSQGRQESIFLDRGDHR